MFPAYGAGGGGGGGRGGHHHSRRGGHGHGHQQYPVWDNNPQGRPSGSGFMIDRGGPSTSNQYYDGCGRRDGGGNRNHRGGGGHRKNWDNRSQNNRGGGGGYQGEVVEIDSSDDDNVVEDAAQQSSGRKRQRSRSSSHSRSRSSKKKKRKRSRSRDRNEAGHSHHQNQRGDRSRHHHHNHTDRNYGDERVERDRRPHHHGGRWDNGDRQPQDQLPIQQQLPPPPTFNFALQQQMQGAMPLMSLMPNQQQLLMGMGMNPMVMNPMAMGLLGALPFTMDNNPNIPNPFDQFQSMMNQQQQGLQNMQGEMERPERVSRNSDRHFFHAQEEQRLHVSQSFPKKVFLEEVNLHSDFAFRLDTSSNPIQMNHRSIPPQQKSSYEGGVNKGIFGATEDEISKVFNKFHTLRCKLPDNVSDSGSDESDGDEPVKKVKRDSAAKNFISLEKEDKERRRRGDTSRDFDSFSFERKDGSMSVRDRTEHYNKEVRNQPQNISLWIEFVQFQDKVWEDESKQFEQDQPVWGKQAKRKVKSKKALLEKKVAILEKALAKNPTNLQLNLLRLEYLLELYKPRHVLTEWKKLVTQYQQIVPFWIEYLLFSASQLMIFSTSSNASVFETCFQKFRLMMNPQYPEFQRPKKFPLFISDITFSLSLLLKNAGFMERAVSLHQAQLEFDFYCPKQLFKDESLLNWHEESGVFETFWGRGTPRFGEIGAKGWQNFDQEPITDTFPVAVSDSSVSEFEDTAFEDANQRFGITREERERENSHLSQKSNTWLNMESFRSKLYWLPWKTSSSDAEDCDDINRVVSANDLKNFICPVPLEINFISEFDRQAAYFRHLVSFLLTLREDFLPHTQTVELVCSPFLGITLTESLSLFNEIYYWRRLADLYVGTNNSEPESKAHHVFAPEGFKLADVVSANVTSEELKPVFFNLVLDTSAKSQDQEPTSTDADIESKKQSVLKENDGKFMEMFQRTIEAGIDLLDSEFACTLFEMFLRFQQKLTCEQSSDIKQKIKFAKALMKKDKIRNSAGGYRELAMLEYFGNGNTEKAIDLLVRTTNATAKSLNLQDWDSVDWEKDWKTIVDLISLYRQLAELYLHQGDSISDAKAYYTLVLLGNCFEALEPEGIEMDEQNQWKPKSNVLLKAIRSYEKVMAMLIPNYRHEKEESTSASDKDEKDEQFVDSEVYYKWNGGNCVEFLLQQRNLIVEWSCSFALFQFFTNGFDAASQVFENILGRLSKEQLNRREGYNPELIRIHIREQLYINWCNLAGRCLIKDPLMNSKFRRILRLALEEFPSSPPLLLLFTDVENQTSVAGKLWRLMMANMKQESDKVITHWPPLIMGIGLARKIEELEHDEEVGLPCFGLGGPAVPQDTIFYKLDSMLAVAEQHPGARHCPLLWRTHLKLLALRAREGKDIERAKATFYEAVRHCPSSKAIYLDGVTYFPELLQEVNDLLTEKQLLIRLPLQELDVHLELDEEEVGSEKNHKDSQSQESVDDNECSGEANSQGKSQEDKSEGELGESD